MPLAGGHLAALAYAPALCTAPLIAFAYFVAIKAIESGRVTSSDFFISSAIDLGLANRVGGTGVALLIVALAISLCVRAAFVAQLGAEWRAAVLARGHAPAGNGGDASGVGPFFAHSAVLDPSAEAAEPAASLALALASAPDWNQWSVRCALSGAAIGIAVTHFNYAFNSVAHLSLAFAAFLLILVAVLAQCAVDAQLEDAASAAIAASSAHRGGAQIDADVRTVLVGGSAAAKHGSTGAGGLPLPHARSIAAALSASGGLPAHCRLRRWLAAAVVLGFVGMFATIAFSLALSAACELALVAALIASIASWAPDLARVRMRLDFAPLSTAGDTDELAAVVRVSA